MKGYLELLIAFLRMGCIAFGGGYAIVPIAENELIKKRGWLTSVELMDYYTIAQITPGIIAINLATFVGNKQKGMLGGLVATLGFMLPGVTLIILAATFISNFEELIIVQHAFAGIRIAVGALILDTVIRMGKTSIKDIKGIIIFILVFIVAVIPSGIIPSMLRSPVFLVSLSGLIGLLIYRNKN